jgi:hypothetical protein
VPAGIQSWVSVPLTPPAPSVTGTQYAIVVSAPDAFFGHYEWIGNHFASSPYADGNEFYSYESGVPWIAQLSGDAGFKTYVDVPTTYDFSGFFSPVDNPPVPNLLKAGSAVPVKFSLDGDQGLGVLAVGYPKSTTAACPGGVAPDPVEETTTDSHSGLSYDPFTDTYTYVWKTDKGWKGTCRTLTVQLDDGSSPHTAIFQFK